MGLSQHKKAKKKEKRDIQTPTLSLATLLSPNKIKPLTPIVHHRPKNLKLIEDRRTYHPDKKNRAAAALDHPKHKLKIAPQATKKALQRAIVRRGPQGKPLKSKRSTRLLSPHIAFQAPKRILICIRRKIREQVLHALKRTGKGAGAPKHRNQYSSIRC